MADMIPATADVEALRAHTAKHTQPICRGCGGGDWQFTRISALPDMMAPEAPPVESMTSDAVPVAVLMCKRCYRLEFFAWLPIKDAYDAASAARVGV